MRKILALLTFSLSLLLGACGGGGGSPGLSTASSSTFTVLAPSAVTLQVGSLQQYAIKGGVKPYTVYSSDPAVAMGWIGGDDNVSVGTVVAGKATVTVADAKNAKFDIVVTSGASMPFYMTAASAITITPGGAYAQTYTLGGGTPPYVATSSFPSVATVVVNGNQMTITGVQVSATGSNITVRDSAGATLTTTVTIGTVPLAINPAKLTAPIGVTFRSVITGGTPPYRTLILDNCSTAQIVQGNILQATTAMACTGAVITVIDANNQTIAVDYTVSAGTAALQIAPTTLSIPENPNTPDIPLLVYGANEGSLVVFSTDTSILAPKTPVKNSDGTYTITLTGGDTCYKPAVPAVAGVDGNNDGDYLDPVDTPPAAAQPSVPAGRGVPITITVIDASGRQGTSNITIQDNGKGGAGCT